MYVGLMWDVCEHLIELGYDAVVEIKPVEPKYNWDFQWDYRYKQDELVESALDLRYGFIEAPAGSGKTPVAAAIIANAGHRAVMLVEEQAPFYQAYETLKACTDMPVGLFGDGVCDIQPVTICMVQTWKAKMRVAYQVEELEALLKRDYDPKRYQYFPSADIRKAYNKYKKMPDKIIEYAHTVLGKLKHKVQKDAEIIEYLRDAGTVIIDEAHNMGAESYLDIVESLHLPHYIIGMSATPFREDDRKDLIYAVCGPILNTISISEAIDNNMIVPITFVVQDAPKKDYGYTNTDTRFPTYERQKQFREVKTDYIRDNDDRHKMYAAFVEWCAERNKSCAVIVSEVKHGNNMAKHIPGAVELYGDAKKNVRDAVWEKLNRKEIQCVITTLMGEATNVPSLNAVAIAAGGKSKKDFIQRMRCSRIFNGTTIHGPEEKDEGLVYFTYDHADFLRSHSATILKYTKDYVKQHSKNTLHYL